MAIAIFLALIIIMAIIGARSLRRKYLFICKGDCLYSEILKEKRNIWVYLPKGEEPDREHYPVVYLLDADEHYAAFREMIQQQDAAGNKLFPDMIVVGIPNTSRSRDLTPTFSEHDSEGKKLRKFKPSGGGDNFISFIKKELIPYVETKYGVTSERTIIGHSLGGLAVINILLHHPEMFNRYIASDPSMWWDSKIMLKEAERILERKRFDGKALYVGIANTMPPGMDIEQMRGDTSTTVNHIQSIFELTDMLQQHQHNGLRFARKYYEHDNHNTVLMKAAYDGMQFLLRQEVPLDE
jgi:predicted alpha/beta superfamily hydrolase